MQLQRFKNGGVAAFIDAEHALDPVYAQALGVDIDNLYLSQPDHGNRDLKLLKHLFEVVQLTSSWLTQWQH